MFTIEQIDDLHAQLGSAKTLPEYVRAVKALGVERYESYLADGRSEYFGRGGSGRVLVFHGGVFGCSSRMNGKPSSPVLRGLGASNGARLLDPPGTFRMSVQIQDL